MKKKKEVSGSTINIILVFGGIIFMYLFIHYTYEWFHWSRNFYDFIIIVSIPITWSQLIMALLGKRTIGYVIADKINSKRNRSK